MYLLAWSNPYINLSEAMGIVITGLAIVFLVLIVLVITFYIMGAFFSPKKAVKEEVPAPKKPEATKKIETPKKTSNNNYQIVAAITAALNEYLGKGNFIIKKIRPAKIGNKSSGAWGTDGKSENIKPF